MPVFPCFLLMAQSAQGVVEVPLHFRRPSAVLATAKGLPATLVAFDERGTVQISGAPGDVERTREYLRLIDVPRNSLRLRVTVVSPLDHLTWEVDARLAHGQRWRTADDETGTEITLEPLVSADGTLTVKLLARCRGTELSSTFRLPKGQSRSIELGGVGIRTIRTTPAGETTVTDAQSPLPKITVRYVGV